MDEQEPTNRVRAMVEVALCAGLAIIVVAIVFIAEPLLRREPKK